MKSPVDLSELHLMTGNDPDLENALFEEFIKSFERGLSELKDKRIAETEDLWRKKAHALKGISLNLGAHQLAELCRKAHECSDAGVQVKNRLLEDIDAEYLGVRAFLEGILRAA